MSSLSKVLPQITPERYGPWAVIAGASEGTGAEYSRQLAAAGINVFLVSRREEALNKLAVEIESKYRVEVRILPLNLSQPDAAEKMFKATANIEVGMYVSNAGASDVVVTSILEQPLDKLQDHINFNVATVTKACLLFIGPMRKRGRGGIVVMASVSGLVGGQPGASLYSAVKAFDLVWGESLYFECKQHGVDAIAIGAPPMATPLAKEKNMQMTGLYDPEDVVRTSLLSLGKQPSYIFNFVGVNTEPGEMTAARRDSAASPRTRSRFASYVATHLRAKLFTQCLLKIHFYVILYNFIHFTCCLS